MGEAFAENSSSTSLQRVPTHIVPGPPSCQILATPLRAARHRRRRSRPCVLFKKPPKKKYCFESTFYNYKPHHCVVYSWPIATGTGCYRTQCQRRSSRYVHHGKMSAKCPALCNFGRGLAGGANVSFRSSAALAIRCSTTRFLTHLGFYFIFTRRVKLCNLRGM